jgi:hypothetical protein
MLKAYDLPGLATALAPRKVLVANITNGMGEPGEITKMPEAQSSVYKDYMKGQVNEHVSVIDKISAANFEDVFLQWLK